MARVRLAAGDLELELAPEVGGSVAAFRLLRGRGEAVPLFRESPEGFTDVLESACFPLVPYSNRIRDGRFCFAGREVRLKPNLPPQRHPLHGQGWRAPWSVVRADEASVELAFDHAPDAWPWAYRARQRFALDDGGLEATLSVANASDQPMPAGLGLHPYCPADDDTVLSTRVRDVWNVDAEVLPIGLAPATGRYDLFERRISRAGLDNGYEGWSGSAEIRWPTRDAGVRIVSAVERFQVWSPPEGGVFCAEPVTHANDAFSHPQERWPSLGLKVLQPGQRLELAARFEAIRRLD